MNLFNRAEVIDQNFTKYIKNDDLPDGNNELTLSNISISHSELISIFESQVFSRHMDLKARELKEKGESFYTIGSSGHESNAVFGNIFPLTDIAFLHYRSVLFLLSDQNSCIIVHHYMIWRYRTWHPLKIQLAGGGIRLLVVKD